MSIIESRINDKIEAFIKSLFSESNLKGWVCLNEIANSYNINSFSQKAGIVKYCLNANTNKISSVYFTIDLGGTYCLEVKFTSDKDYIFELPLTNEHLELLKKLHEEIKFEQSSSLNAKIIHDLEL